MVLRQGFEKLMSKGLGKSKARKMLKDGTAHGKPLTRKQEGLFGLIASGKKPLMKKNPSKPSGSGGCFRNTGQIGI